MPLGSVPVGHDRVLTVPATPTASALLLRPWADRDAEVAPRAVEAVTAWALGLPRNPPIERLELLHSVGNVASCRVAEKTGFRLSAVLPPLLPDFPDDGHLHIRPVSG